MSKDSSRAERESSALPAHPAGGAPLKVREAVVETIWDNDGRSAYQTRVKCGSFRIHIFWRGDRDPDMHDHPADFWTFPLVSYVEELPLNQWGWVAYRVVRAFRLHRRRAPYPHRVMGAWTGDYEGAFVKVPTYEQRPIVTLGWWGKKHREWGFLVNGGWVPWRSYVSKPGWSDGAAAPSRKPLNADENLGEAA